LEPVLASNVLDASTFTITYLHGRDRLVAVQDRELPLYHHGVGATADRFLAAVLVGEEFASPLGG
jgi:hypothetical protein